MTITAEMISDVRRMVNEADETNYTDSLLETMIAKYPTTDERGTDPYYWSETSTIPVKVTNTSWIPTYNLHLAAADIWEEKAAVIAGMFDFSADGGSYQRSQQYQQAMNMSKYHRSRGGIQGITLIKKPDEIQNPVWIGNLPEVD
jgi:hypothetical protein